MQLLFNLIKTVKHKIYMLYKKITYHKAKVYITFSDIYRQSSLMVSLTFLFYCYYTTYLELTIKSTSLVLCIFGF